MCCWSEGYSPSARRTPPLSSQGLVGQDDGPAFRCHSARPRARRACTRSQTKSRETLVLFTSTNHREVFRELTSNVGRALHGGEVQVSANRDLLGRCGRDRHPRETVPYHTFRQIATDVSVASRYYSRMDVRTRDRALYTDRLLDIQRTIPGARRTHTSVRGANDMSRSSLHRRRAQPHETIRIGGSAPGCRCEARWT